MTNLNVGDLAYISAMCKHQCHLIYRQNDRYRESS